MNMRKNYPFTIAAWVLLPEHLHCILTLPENDNDFSVRWNGIKNALRLWQSINIELSVEPR